MSNEYGAELVRVDAQTGKVDHTLKVDGTPHGLAAAGSNLWVTAAVSGTTHRGGTLTVLGETFGELQSIDPNHYNSQALRIAYDGLVGIRRAAGAAGTTLVPNLATALPTPVNGEKTYAFRLRKGIRYSTGKPVHASDIRRAIERSENVTGGPFSSIRGAPVCHSPATCDLSAGIQTDDATGSVTFRLLKPDPEFLYKLVSRWHRQSRPAPRPPPSAWIRSRPPGHTRSPGSTPVSRWSWFATPTSESGHAPPSPTAIPTASSSTASKIVMPPTMRRSRRCCAARPTSPTGRFPTACRS